MAWTVGGSVYQTPGDVEPAELTSQRIDSILGPALLATAPYTSADGRAVLTEEITLAEQGSALLYQVRLRPSGSDDPERFTILDTEGPGLDLAGSVDVLALLSPGYTEQRVEPGDRELTMRLPQGAPVLLWSETAGRGYVLGFLDRSLGPSLLRLVHAEDGDFRVAAEVGPRIDDPSAAPRLFLERVETGELGQAFAGFRQAVAGLAPAPPIPPGFRQQWGSWYLYAEEMDESLIRAQIDGIADRYADLGPWQVVVDAGWYLSGEHPDGEMGVVDAERFPSGMRALVDYAHARGVGVVLYASAPWVESRPSLVDWWVVQLGFVRDHVDWLIPVEEHADGTTYVYDLTNPELRDYLDGVIRRYLVDFDADGILLDMVGLIGDYSPPLEGDPTVTDVVFQFHDVAQSMEVYRFFWEAATKYKPQVWLEGAWGAPPLARSYAHTWRYGDEAPLFSHPYPYGGLVEHVAFAAAQEQFLGRRSHVGFVWGGDETLPIQRQWLATAVAMQRQTILSTDLAGSPPEITALYREYLAALRPFSADPVFGPGIPPEAFSTTVDGTTYLALLNEAPETRTIEVDLTEHGLSARAGLVAFDPERREAFATGELLAAEVPGQTLRLVALRAAPGVLWADRSWAVSPGGAALVVDVEAAPVDAGRLWIYAPGAALVSIDGGKVDAATTPGEPGILRVDLPDGAAHQVRVEL